MAITQRASLRFDEIDPWADGRAACTDVCMYGLADERMEAWTEAGRLDKAFEI